MPVLRVRIVHEVRLSDLPAASPESADRGGKPLRLSKLADIQNVSTLSDRSKWNVNAHGKAFKISSITASRTFDCKSPNSFLRISWISAWRCLMVFWKRLLISILRVSQARYSCGNRVPRPIVPIKMFKALSSRSSERHNTMSSLLEHNFLKMEFRGSQPEDTYKRRRIWAAP